MKKLRLILLVSMFALLAIFATGCASGDGSGLEGKYVATFELNGGILDYKTSSSKTKVNFAYYPDTYILSPDEIPGYNLYRSGYNFTGWYKSKECNPTEKWDFKNDVITTESLTLYAGWEKAVKHTFTVCYTDESGNVVSLYEYKDSAGKVFEDWRDSADDRKGYTPIGYYSDEALTTPWDFDFVHPGGETDLDFRVFVKYIEGEWEMVSNFSQLKSAIRSGENVYITQDIDCGGAELSFKGSYGGIIEGNEHTVSNFTVTSSDNVLSVKRCAIFETLAKDAEIRNINFSAVKYVINVSVEGEISVEAAAIALSADGAKITSVTVNGEFKTNYKFALPDIEAAVFKADGTAAVEGFDANVTVTVE